MYCVTLSVDGAICVGNDDNKCFVQPKLHALKNEKLSGQVDIMLNFVFFTPLKLLLSTIQSVTKIHIPYSVVKVRNHD